MNIKKIAVAFLALTLIVSPHLSLAEEKDFPSPELLQQLIDFVVENNPILQSQRKVVEQIESVPMPERVWETQLTFKGSVSTMVDEDTYTIRAVPSAGLELEIPLYDPSKKRSVLQQRIAFSEKLEQAKQKYSSLKNSIVSDLLDKVSKLSKLNNQKKNLIQLKSYLGSNLESLEKQVKAGVEEQDALWTLNERVMNVNTKIYNISSDIETLKWKTATTLGGKEWEKLLKMLDKVGT